MFEASSNNTLAQLGYIVLASFRTKAYHLFNIEYRGTVYETDIENDGESPLMRNVKLSSMSLQRFEHLKMIYDFGCDDMNIETIDKIFAVCMVSDFSLTDLNEQFVFTAKTDNENSLVCPIEKIPANAVNIEKPWRAFRIAGTLDFSLIGILSAVSAVLAENKIGIFAVSTYDTDYIFTKEENFDSALNALKNAGYKIIYK